MLDVKSLLAKMLTLLDGYLVVEERTLNFSFSNQRYKSFTLAVPKTGYTPLGIVGYEFSTVDWIFSQAYISGNTANFFIFRNSNITASANVKIKVLYRKD